MPDYDAVVTFDPGRRETLRGKFGGHEFHVAVAALESFLFDRQFASREFSDRAMDLFRVAAAAFAVDRVARRRGQTRSLDISLPVRDHRFWSRSEVAAVVVKTLDEVTGDDWSLQFLPDNGPRQPVNASRLNFPQRPPVVCLYSGGLDSAAGLANRLADGDDREFLAVVVRQGSNQSSGVESQLAKLKDRVNPRLSWTIVNQWLKSPKVRLIEPSKRPCAKRYRDQESTQRSRTFLYAALAGVVAAQCGASEVEMYESGVGAVNLPLQDSVGWRATRRCHPQFLELMGRLVEMVVESPIKFRLPFIDLTKAEVIRRLAGRGLDDLIRDTFSCVHFPRPRQTHSQCGLCPGCLFRRQALAAAGMSSLDGPYQRDIFGGTDAVNAIPEHHLRYLKAILAQVDDLEELESGGAIPTSFVSHLVGTLIVDHVDYLNPYIKLFLRYRREWLDVLATVRGQDYSWAAWLPTPSKVAS